MIARLPSGRLARAARTAALLLAAASIVVGCATPNPAPVEERPAVKPIGGGATGAATLPNGRPATYTVRRGDTLYQIALDNGLDYRDLAAWNHIANVDRIYVGEVLQLAAPGQAEVAGSATGNTVPGSGPAASPASAPNANASAPNANAPNAQPAPGVTVTPLRVEPPIVASTLPPAPGAPAVAGSATIPSGATAPPGSAAAAASSAPAVQGGVETEPKAIKLPYSDRAVRELERAASSVPAPDQAPAAAPADTTVATAAPSLGASVPQASTAAPSVGTGAPQASAAAGPDEQLGWVWPAKGKVIAQFSDSANFKGIDIAGTMGEPVYASAAGKVVYAGSGLRGYGKLIIIKHNATYLSAYAHNSALLVKEGQQVARGQEIAQMGNSDADKVMLHFEIRRYGKPMDPEKFLPPA